jgi:hypothetical protein
MYLFGAGLGLSALLSRHDYGRGRVISRIVNR